MKQLNVVIAGTAGSGKTTVAREIYLALTNAGFDVDIKHDFGDKPLSQDDLDKRKEAVKKGAKIKIATAQISRSQLI